MKELISRFSSYNIFNYLVPGAALCLLLHERGFIDVDRPDLLSRLVIFYVTGMAISRVGSLMIDPLLKRAGLVPRSNYVDYVRASADDDKVPVLLETSNTYRTMTSACLIGIAAYLFSLAVPRPWLRHDAIGCVAVAVMGVLFTVAYVKQNRAVTRRVRANIGVDTAEDVRFLIRSAKG